MPTSKYGKYLYGANKYSRAAYTELVGQLDIQFVMHSVLTVKHVILLKGGFTIAFGMEAWFSRLYRLEGDMFISFDMSKAGINIYLGPFWKPDEPSDGFWIPDDPTQGFWKPDKPTKLPWEAITDG